LRAFSSECFAITAVPLAASPGASYVRVVAGQALPIDFNAMREKRVASELERLAAAQRVHDRIQARLREARRREFERAAGVPLEDVRPVLGA
jgi:hypothetical protein